MVRRLHFDPPTTAIIASTVDRAAGLVQPPPRQHL